MYYKHDKYETSKTWIGASYGSVDGLAGCHKNVAMCHISVRTGIKYCSCLHLVLG